LRDTRQPDPRPRLVELVASLRSEPANYNRYFDASAAAELMALLTQARLVRALQELYDGGAR